jgi:hypothetical protein
VTDVSAAQLRCYYSYLSRASFTDGQDRQGFAQPSSGINKQHPRVVLSIHNSLFVQMLLKEQPAFSENQRPAVLHLAPVYALCHLSFSPSCTS